LKSWTADIGLANSANTLTAGVLYLSQFYLGSSATITQIIFRVSAASLGLTGGYFGIYNQSGTLLGSVANTTTFNSATTYTLSFSSSISLAAGQYYIGTLFVGGTPPTIIGWTGNALSNAGYTSSTGTLVGNGRFMSYGSGLTSLPTIAGSGTQPFAVSGLLAYGLI